jgi:hypothetical protein
MIGNRKLATEDAFAKTGKETCSFAKWFAQVILNDFSSAWIQMAVNLSIWGTH